LQKGVLLNGFAFTPHLMFVVMSGDAKTHVWASFCWNWYVLP